MTQAGAVTMPQDSLLPRPPGGNGPGAVLALVVHAGLVAALTVSVDWRMRTPEAVSAELWASVPQAAAPPAPEPTPQPAPAPAPPPPAPAPPPPRAAPAPAEPDIAIEREARRKAEAERKKAEADAALARKKAEAEALAERKRVLAEKKRAAEEKAQREKDEKAAREAKAQEARLAEQREENLRRMMSQAGGATEPTRSVGASTRNAAPSAAYAGRLVALIRGNLVFAGNVPENVAAEVEVSASASGSIIARRLIKSSGHKDWDEAVLRAIDRTPTLPRDVDGRVPSRLVITFRPRE